MNASDWIAIGGVAVGIITLIGTAIERRLRAEREKASYLTRAEHEEICAERNERVEKSIGELREDMERRAQDLRNLQDRQHSENRDTLKEIRNSITGTHKRLDAFLLHKTGSGG
jgi:molecular chaperone GrpE (heat shock protein)